MNRVSTRSNSADYRDDSSVTHAVVETVADAKGVSPIEINPPLATVIDPDALEAFVASIDERSPGGRGSIEFAYSGYQVTVSGDGSVDVSPLEPDQF